MRARYVEQGLPHTRHGVDRGGFREDELLHCIQIAHLRLFGDLIGSRGVLHTNNMPFLRRVERFGILEVFGRHCAQEISPIAASVRKYIHFLQLGELSPGY